MIAILQVMLKPQVNCNAMFDVFKLDPANVKPNMLTKARFGLLNMKITYPIKYLKTLRVNKTLFDHMILNIFDCGQ